MDPLIIIILIVVLLTFIIVVYYLSNNDKDNHSYYRYPYRYPLPSPHIVGGCAGTRFGCCLDGRTSRFDAAGSNCPV